MPYVDGTREMVELPIYDTVDLRRLGERVILFSTPIGVTEPSIWREQTSPKNWWETNLFQHGVIESPNSFNVRNLSVLLYDKHGPLPVFDRTGMGNLWAKSYLEFRVNQKIYWEGPLSLVADPVCQLGGLEFLHKMAGASGAGMERALQLLNRHHEHPLDVLLQPQMSFEVLVTPYTPVCRQITVRVVLSGVKMRAVL